MITELKGDYLFLSNSALISTTYEGIIYPTVEHAFAASRTADKIERDRIKAALSPYLARKMAEDIPFKGDWSATKTSIMYQLVLNKFLDFKVRKLLLNTGELKIYPNTGELLWGCVYENFQWKGENRLGRILMKVRSEYQKNKPIVRRN